MIAVVESAESASKTASHLEGAAWQSKENNERDAIHSFKMSCDNTQRVVDVDGPRVAFRAEIECFACVTFQVVMIYVPFRFLSCVSNLSTEAETAESFLRQRQRFNVIPIWNGRWVLLACQHRARESDVMYRERARNGGGGTEHLSTPSSVRDTHQHNNIHLGAVSSKYALHLHVRNKSR